MMPPKRWVWLVCILLFSAMVMGPEPTTPEPPEDPHGFTALVFSKTAGFRHDSIEAGIAAIKELAVIHNFELDATEDAAAFTDANLANYEVVIFLSTTGDILNDDQQAAFERYIRAGGGFVGIHAAADTEYDWPFYGGLVGAYFESHPPDMPGTIHVVDDEHPSTQMLPERWTRFDEWYNFQDNPRGNVHVLATLSEKSYNGGTMGADHPIAWCQVYEGARSWYTGGGHTIESFSEPLFREHILYGIEYAAGEIDGDCGGTVWDNYDRVTLDDNTENPMALDIAPDGRVFYVERGGDLQIYDPQTALTTTAGTIDVVTSNEDGLIGIALDPEFETNNWVYLFYSPVTETDKQYVSRFTMTGNTLDISSEALLLDILVQREQCCHSGGAMRFDAAGNLFIATGDNTNPFESSGFAPIDERPGREAWDAQKSSSNTNDLRGKILRITPQPDGTYTVPTGNLFEDPADGRPEIYIMGLRNPFRFSIDSRRGWLYWGDVGPDAGNDDTSRGPRGFDEWNQAKEAGNYGWPYCIADNKSYRDYDFSASTSGSLFNCDAPVNDSPNNTGATNLPPALPAWIWYPYNPSTEFPDVTEGVGRTALAGPVYYREETQDIQVRLPDYFDDTLFIYEWARNWIHEVKLDDQGGILDIQPFLSNQEFLRPIDMKAGPDGALYLLEWGTGFGGNNEDSRLTKISFVQGSRAPVIQAEVAPLAGQSPLEVQFDASRSFDPDPNEPLTFAWDFEADGTVDATDPIVSHTYTENGVFTATLTATDPAENVSVASFQIVVGNSYPTIMLDSPADGSIFDWGEPVAFNMGAMDPEDGSTETGGIACDDLDLQLFIGHDDHTHPLDQATGCTGSFVASEEDHGGEGDRLFYVMEASYTDKGDNGVGQLTSRALHILQPRRFEAEHYLEQEGVRTEDSQDPRGGGVHLAFIDDGDYAAIGPINLKDIFGMTFRIASAGSGGRIAVRLDAPDGPELGYAHVEFTGGWQTFRDVTIPVEDPGGTHTLYLVFENEPGATDLFNVNWVVFHGPGVRADATVQGLQGEYYRTPDLTGSSEIRHDAQINFNWAGDGPIAGYPTDNFSARWKGFVVPDESGAYTFYARSDDGMRVWLDGALIIDKWQVQSVTETPSQTIQLNADNTYELEVTYYDAQSTAQAHLLWSSDTIIKQPVPNTQLYPEAIAIPQEDNGAPVTEFTVDAIYPNPVRNQGVVHINLPQTSKVTVIVHDALGRQVGVLYDGLFGSGRHQIDLDTDGLASGVYFCRVQTEDAQHIQQFVVVR
ncbi:MAG: ThuA domain-containing protein [Bacteroidota bacterium]